MAGADAIKIDPIAASEDLKRIASAMEDLRKAKIGLVNVKKCGRDDCIGETAYALVDKADELLNLLDRLVDNLEDTEREIKKTIQRFQEKDEEIAATINGSGISAASAVTSIMDSIGGSLSGILGKNDHNGRGGKL